jgi:D-glycero-alpha-D-manno-heptose 1-phosphate guanylyltransferase
MVTEGIILAGGKGTRLQHWVPQTPKCLAPVIGKPFIDYVITNLVKQNIDSFIFSLGFLAEQVVDHLEKQWPQLHKKYATENKPLGTGGAIKKALQLAASQTVIVTNGDTIFKASLSKAAWQHYNTGASCTICLKTMHQPNRYGTVLLNRHLQVTSFREKQILDVGFINAGSYILNTDIFKFGQWPEIFSFEKDYLQQVPKGLFGYEEDAYFIDIGIPEDYEKAQFESIYF